MDVLDIPVINVSEIFLRHLECASRAIGQAPTENKWIRYYSVTRWLDYLYNIWPFRVTMKIWPKA